MLWSVRVNTVCHLVVVALLTTSAAYAQVATGTYPYGTFDHKGFDTINIGNLNVGFSIPILNKTGRGVPLYYNLVFNNSVWYPRSVTGSSIWTPVQSFGWAGDTEIATGYVTYAQTILTRGACMIITNYNWVYYDTFGASHPFQGITRETIPSGTNTCSSQSPPSPLTAVAADNSGYTLTVTAMSQAQLSSASGAQIHPPVSYTSGSATYTDNNGNQITIDSSGHIKDTTGAVALTVAGAAPAAHTFAYTDTTGISRSVSMTYSSYTVRTNFGCSNVTEFGPTSTSLVSSITMPDNSTYRFTYESTPGYTGAVTGRIATVTLPTGGVIQYSYTGGNNGIVCADGSTAGLTRSISSDGGSAASSWRYVRSVSGSTSSTTVTDGLNNTSTYTFVQGEPQTSQTIGVTADYYETNRVVKQGTTTALMSRSTCYNGASAPCTTTALTLPITQIVTYESFNGGATRCTNVSYNTYGLKTDEYDFDFGTPTACGPELRHEVWTYPASGIANLLTADQIYDGVGNLAAKTTYQYDTTSLGISSGVPNHISVNGQRGNLTNVNYYYNSSSYISTSFTYEDTGSVLTASTPNGTTSYTYSADYVYPQASAPPTPSSGVGLSTGATYYSSAGLLATTTDANGTVTTYTYDSMLNPHTVITADSGQNTVESLAFNSESVDQHGIVTYHSGAASGDTETLLDGYGRSSRVAVNNGQGNDPWYQGDTCYDGNNRVSFVSYSYQSTGFAASKRCSGAGNTYAYDALGRLTSVTEADGKSVQYSYSQRAVKVVDENGESRIYQLDGLGRITNVCEVTSVTMTSSGGPPTACGLDIGGTGYLTTYAYNLAGHWNSVTQGVQSRSFVTDWIGRLISASEPESGTLTYGYSYNSTGLVVMRTRPAANQTNPSVTTTTTTQYDSIGRVLSVTYGDGTPTKYFSYDASAGWAENQSNLKGRLSKALVPVDGNAAASLFSYDGIGRVTQLVECMPFGCNNASLDKTLRYTYDWAGNVTSSSDGADVTNTYTYSPANEILSISSSLNDASHPPNLVSNVQNGPFGPLTWRLGNGLTGVRTYDALGRLSGGFVCNGSSLASCSGGTQLYGFTAAWSGGRFLNGCDTVLNRCINYSYDDFGRVTGRTVTQGQADNYTYVYDRWGNRWQQNPQSGGWSSNLIFNTNTNQITTSGFSYDAAGNLLSDGLHSYAYDAEGHITMIDGGTTARLSYDALNHKVEDTGAGSDGQQYVVSLSGTRITTWDPKSAAEIQGQSYWGNLPIEYYDHSQAHYQHQDWLETVRLRTTYNGAVEGGISSLPFGDGLTVSGTDTDGHHFAGLDRDYSTATEQAEFRRYSEATGRWMSPDSYSGSYDFTNPQSLNRYAYVLNSPLSANDPSGLCPPPARDGEAQPCFRLGDGDPGMIDGIDEFAFMQIPVYGYGFGYIPYQSWSGVVDGTPYKASTVNWGWGIIQLGTGFDLLGNWTPDGNVTQGSSGGGGGQTSAAKKGNIFACAADFADQYSIAGGLHDLGIGTSGVGGFVTNALGGNAFSGLTNLIQSFGSGEGGGHSVFYNMGQGIVAGPAQGFGAVWGSSIKGTPWNAGPADVATEALVGGGFNAVTGAGESIQTLNGAASLASVGADAAEDFATGVGILKLVYDAGSYGVGLVHCY